ncbi:hypothetical protein [Streptomyces sp. NPDC006739]|uniref:hypothetical protein n=1 Tax=Streptomyces sp. NPDC006739 TaxID=3364763 RepID=UPI0036A8E14C
MASVMGLLEEREAVVRVRVEELQVETDRILVELAAAEARDFRKTRSAASSIAPACM